MHSVLKDGVLEEFRRARPYWLIEPVVGLMFTLLWINAEAERMVMGIFSMVLFGVAIALSRLVPVAALSVVGLTLLLQATSAIERLHSTDWPVYLAIPLVVGLIAAHRADRLRWIALAVGMGGVLTGSLLMLAEGWLSWDGRYSFATDRGAFRMADIAPLLTLAVGSVLLAWGSGVAVNEIRRRRAWQHREVALTEQLTSSEVELAVAHERDRIAQEMHDVVAHSLAVIVAQADGARYLRQARPAAMASALEAIAGSARTALLDVRGMIDGMVDGVAAPQPTLADLAELVDGVRAVGLDIEVTSAGETATLGPAQQTAVYRIVQEGLTNALRHRGRGSAVSVVLDWRGPGLSIQLVSTGEGEASGEPTTGSGRGIHGMQERARLTGGWLAAGADENGDHRLTAFIPYRTQDLTTVPEKVTA